MPRYDYGCPVCGFTEEYIHRISEKPVYYCPECEKKNNKVEMNVLFNSANFIIKGGTEAIHWKEKRLRLKKNEELKIRQLERYGSSFKLKPNIAGVEQESWSDAAKLAKEIGINHESYQPFIEKEKRTSKTSGIDDAQWKKLKEQL